MRVIIRTNFDENYQTLLNKIKSSGVKIHKENKKYSSISVDVPQSDSKFLYEVLELNGIIERDMRHDLD